MSTLFEFTRRLRGLHTNWLPTLDEGFEGGGYINGRGDGPSFNSGDGWGWGDGDSYGDGDSDFGNGCGNGALDVAGYNFSGTGF